MRNQFFPDFGATHFDSIIAELSEFERNSPNSAQHRLLAPAWTQPAVPPTLPRPKRRPVLPSDTPRGSRAHQFCVDPQRLSWYPRLGPLLLQPGPH